MPHTLGVMSSREQALSSESQSEQIHFD
jgi:hypothetical protein